MQYHAIPANHKPPEQKLTYLHVIHHSDLAQHFSPFQLLQQQNAQQHY